MMIYSGLANKVCSFAIFVSPHRLRSTSSATSRGWRRDPGGSSSSTWTYLKWTYGGGVPGYSTRVDLPGYPGYPGTTQPSLAL
eukprot:2577043-Rhodomonas_salina.1